MNRRRQISAAALSEAFEQVAETGQEVTIKTAKVVCEIRPRKKTAAVNPADLVDMSE